MRRFFMSISAAEGNIGDVVIRRAVVQQLRDFGLNSVIFSGAMSDNFIDSFVFGPADAVTPSPTKFVRSLLLDIVLIRRPVVVMAPGPFRVGASPSTFVKHLCLLSLLAAVRMFGGAVLTLGRSVDVSRSYALPVERALAVVSNIYVGRDSRTRDIVGRRCRLYPDYAFRDRGNRISGSVSNNFACRKLLVISLRHDRLQRSDVGIFEELKELASGAGYEVTFAAQVKEDSVENSRLAASLGFSSVDWASSSSHRTQESALVDLYSQAAIVVSDRLHVLILAARSGAIPVVFDRDGVTKIPDALDHVLAPQRVGPDSPVADLDINTEESKRIDRQFADAFSRMASLDLELSRLLGVAR